ncbi:MAG: PfaD family polyunsaturated fatty acid/polyketide biosynthesis protein [Holophagales bacterium]|nr:PfaD family polyunsaturated fatty acid/polyketide biosynthesis protein [Holophagales bacterium]
MTLPASPNRWRPDGRPPAFTPTEIGRALEEVRSTAHVVREDDGRIGLGLGGELVSSGGSGGAPGTFAHLASLPPTYPEWLGDRTFSETHGTRFPYVTGSMANGIASVRLVSEMARAGFLGFFGAAGLSPGRVEGALDELRRELGDAGLPWGANLIHSPNEPALEEAVADLYLRRGVARVEASAYMALTPSVVRYAATGLTTDPTGRTRRKNHLFAKISREEVAIRFLEPPPAEILRTLVERGQLTAAEARLAEALPLAEDLTAEADSGGHTDNRPLTALLPAILRLRDRVAAERGYRQAVRVGAGGGLGTPSSVAAAFALGASYVVTGSVNQACVESGLHESGRALLAEAGIADVIMAPAADMFELGVTVQVLRRGTMFAVRAKKLYELYRSWPSLESIPAAEREKVETQLLRATFAEAWESTRAFWAARDPREVARAEADPKHLMALVFRSYLGLSSRWAIAGEPDRGTDFQIWCGPAMGAFNSWVRGSFLEKPDARTAVQVARNLMEGAAAVTRAQQLRASGLAVPPSAFDFRPRPLA